MFNTLSLIPLQDSYDLTDIKETSTNKKKRKNKRKKEKDISPENTSENHNKVSLLAFCFNTILLSSCFFLKG